MVCHFHWVRQRDAEGACAGSRVSRSQTVSSNRLLHHERGTAVRARQKAAGYPVVGQVIDWGTHAIAIVQLHGCGIVDGYGAGALYGLTMHVAEAQEGLAKPVQRGRFQVGQGTVERLHSGEDVRRVLQGLWGGAQDVPLIGLT